MYRSNWSTHLDSQKLDLSANDPIRPWRLWCLIFRWYFDDDDDIITIIFHGDTDSSRGGHGTWQRMTPQTSMDVRTDSSDSSSDTGGSDSSDARRSSHRLTPNLYNGHI